MLFAEICNHLRWVPYIRLPFKFDPKPLLEEARNLEKLFVHHRANELGGIQGWKSLAIKGWEGKSSNVSFPGNEVIHQGPEVFLETEISQQCPQTLKMLKSLLDWPTIYRARFMWLEAGAEIPAHSDQAEEDLELSINIVLNMPDGCTFDANLNSDGLPDPFYAQIPMKEGEAYLVNVGRKHRVRNHSKQPRIHIIAHGRLKISDQEILEAARNQNKLVYSSVVLDRLLYQSSYRNKPTHKQSLKLSDEWMGGGGSYAPLPDSTKFVVLASSAKTIEAQSFDQRATWGSRIFPAMGVHNDRLIRLEESELQNFLVQQSVLGTQTVVLIQEGIFFRDPRKALFEIIQSVGDFEKSGDLYRGNLIFYPGKLPSIHPQLGFLNLQKWRDCDSPSLLSATEANPNFPSFQMSPENVHDDYTPYWIKPGAAGLVKLAGESAWGTELLRAGLQKQQTFSNHPLQLRDLYLFSYSRIGEHLNQSKIAIEMDQNNSNYSSVLFTLNNEPTNGLNFSNDSNFSIQQMFCVAGGIKPLCLVAQHQNNLAKNFKLNIVDQSIKALENLKRLSECQDLDDFEKQMAGLCWDGDLEKCKSYLEKTLWLDSHRSPSRFIEILSHFKKASWNQIDLLDPSSRLSLSSQMATPGTFAWISNTWSTDYAFRKLGPQKLTEAFENWRSDLAKHLEAKTFGCVWDDSFVIAKDFNQPLLAVTSMTNCRYNNDTFKEINF